MWKMSQIFVRVWEIHLTTCRNSWATKHNVGHIHLWLLHKSRPHGHAHLHICARERSWFFMLCKRATLLHFGLVPVANDNSQITANRDVLRQQKHSQDIPWTLGTKCSEFMFLMPAGLTDVNIIKIEMKDSQRNKSDQATLYSQWLTPNQLSALLDQER